MAEFNPLASFIQGQASREQQQQFGQQRQIRDIQAALSGQAGQPGFDPSSSAELQQLTALDPSAAAATLSTFQALDKPRRQAFFQDARTGLNLLEKGDFRGFEDFASNRLENVNRLSGDPSDVADILQTFASGDVDGTINKLANVEQIGIDQGFLTDPEAERRKKKTPKQREFESLTKGLDKEQIKQATLIELGLSPRAVGSAIQTISDRGIAEQIGTASGIVKQREKFGELTGASRAKTIDKGFEKIAKIDTGIGNIDRAVDALNRGAGVGAIQRFLPSFKAASVELDNIQKSMALDVIGAVTFGALSEGELNLAKEVALPTGLSTPALIQHLKDRKAAQQKLRAYFNEQIQFLDQGGTIAGFLRQQERNQDANLGQQPGVAAQAPAAQQAPATQILRFDAQGNIIQ